MSERGQPCGLQEAPRGATIDRERHSVDVTGSFRSQESDYPQKILGFAQASRRNQLFHPANTSSGVAPVRSAIIPADRPSDPCPV